MFIVGHRGARGEAPENTLGGFRYLRQLGIKAVELDIQVSLDGELLVIHDASLERTSNGHGSVHEKNWAELQGVEVGRQAFPQWPQQERLPSLRAVMQELMDFDHVQFEVKAQSEAHARHVAKVLPALWHEFGFGQRALSTSFNPLYLALLREQAPDIPRGFLFEEDFKGDAIALARELGCRSLGPHQSRCTAELIQAAQGQGISVSTWTVNAPERMRELSDWGVDSIITDLPTLAQQTLGL